MLSILGAVVLAATVTVDSPDPSDYENPRFLSPSGELCLVVRRYPLVADFERITTGEYWRRYAAREEIDKPREPIHGALYRRWPGNFNQLLVDFPFRKDEPDGMKVLVADDGHIVTFAPLKCPDNAELLTIRAPDGAIVRTLTVRDVMTRNDQQWLCRGLESDVRLSVFDDFGTSKLRATLLLTDGTWDAPEARHHALTIDLATGAVPPHGQSLCPTAVRVVSEAGDGRLERGKFVSVGDDGAFDAEDVIPVTSAALLARAVVRTEPEYPYIATVLRITGPIRVDVVVGRNGHVEAARIQPTAFGVAEAIQAALLTWQFEPEATRISGSFLFRLEILRDRRIEVRTVS